MNPFSALTSGLTVEIKTNAGTYNVKLDSDGGPNPILALLKPRATVRSGENTLYTVAPAGEPSDSPWLLFVGLGAVGLVLLGAFALGRASV